MIVKLFPAGAGMNRNSGGGSGLVGPVPRRRGDEPDEAFRHALFAFCSPQARG